MPEFTMRTFAPLLLGLSLLACTKEAPLSDPSPPAPSAAATPEAVPESVASVLPNAGAKTSSAPKIECETDGTVVIRQPGLEDDIRKKLQKTKGEKISARDLASIKSINVSTSKTDWLDPCIFPKLTGIKDVFLGEGDLDDLSLLAAHPTLVSLRASINKVSDLSPLEKLTKLDRLDLGRTYVRDIAPLAALVNLTELELDNTDVDTVQPLAALKKLQRLSLKNTRVTDLSPLAGLGELRSIDISGTQVTDYRALSAQIGRGLKITR